MTAQPENERLRAVPAAETPAAPIPRFEGRLVDVLMMKVSGTVSVVDDGVVVSVDDRVKITGEFRVSAIRHYVDEKTGFLVREQVLRAINETVELCPWDPDDPRDNGVIKAIPR